MTRTNLLYGTVYGSAQSVAENLADELKNRNVAVHLWQPDELEGFVPPVDEWLLIVTSTTGQGDLPDDIAPWFCALKNKAPYLAGLRYAVVGLGDSSYDTFCGGGYQVDELLRELGGDSLAPMLTIDAMETMEPETAALDWLAGWLNTNPHRS
ncbi:MAG: flavodoxin [Shewanella sp.]|nr:flavodoxin [Shewanella sp.]MCF1429325.1 flavodoxin [Shewanella sp.]MCF1440032.1 flavodoxin [Shewanella sp.]MCF1456527.1 flavodoxin [Shewanella sp.]